MHLPQRRGGDRLPLEAREMGRERPAQLLLDDADGRVRREGRHAVLQQLQLFDQLGAQHIHARGKLLPDLDERGAELEQALAQPHGERHKPGLLGSLAELPEVRPLQVEGDTLEDKLQHETWVKRKGTWKESISITHPKFQASAKK